MAAMMAGGPKSKVQDDLGAKQEVELAKVAPNQATDGANVDVPPIV